MQNSIVIFTFSALDPKYSFWVNLVSKNQKLSKVTLCDGEFNDDVHFFCFRQEIPFLGKFGPKNQNVQFKLKFGI